MTTAHKTDPIPTRRPHRAAELAAAALAIAGCSGEGDPAAPSASASASAPESGPTVTRLCRLTYSRGQIPRRGPVREVDVRTGRPSVRPGHRPGPVRENHIPSVRYVVGCHGSAAQLHHGVEEAQRTAHRRPVGARTRSPKECVSADASACDGLLEALFVGSPLKTSELTAKISTGSTFLGDDVTFFPAPSLPDIVLTPKSGGRQTERSGSEALSAPWQRASSHGSWAQKVSTWSP